jgi:hypothetical protein
VYDFERDKLFEHQVTFEEAVECFFSDFEVRRNKKFRDRYQLIGKNIGRAKAQGDLPSEAWEHCSDYYRLAVMKTKKASALSQEAIDRRVVAQSENDSAWEAPIRVKRSKPASLSIPGDLAARAAFLARLHREADLKSWVERVLRDRVELEEFAFAEAKKNLTP